MAQRQTGFGPPPEVVRYFDDKGLTPGFHWQDVWQEEHAHAFTVAKAVETELLATFKASIARAQKEGLGFETWRTRVVEDLNRIGWGGPRLVADPVGAKPDAVVDFTAPNRLKTIFWGNMASARAAGQWERAQRTKAALPYLLYVRTTAADPRKEHLGWVGTILPVDDPFWSSHFPPNGWLCKCSVRQITARERDRLLALEPADGNGIRYSAERPVIETRAFTNKRTGEIVHVPVGIDPGWGGNPGLARVKGVLRALEQSLVEAGPADAARKLDDLWASPWTRVVSRLPPKQARQVWLPAGVSPRLQVAMGAKSPLVSINGADVGARANHDGRYKDGRSYEDLRRLPQAIAEGAVVADANPRRRGMIWNLGRAWWRAIVTRSDTGLLRVISMHQRPEKAARRAIEASQSGK